MEPQPIRPSVGTSHARGGNLLRCLTVGALLLAGCHSIKFKQQSGTELTSTDNGWKATTYVTPEEYDKMTPAERERLNASVGVSATVASWGNSKPQSRDISTKDLDQAKKDAKE